MAAPTKSSLVPVEPVGQRAADEREREQRKRLR
jgi:hypothetical protein